MAEQTRRGVQEKELALAEIIRWKPAKQDSRHSIPPQQPAPTSSTPVMRRIEQSAVYYTAKDDRYNLINQNMTAITNERTQQRAPRQAHSLPIGNMPEKYAPRSIIEDD